MKNRGVYLYHTVSSLFMMFLLSYFFVRVQDIFSGIIILPFLLCSIMLFLKSLCLLLKKDKLAHIFQKIFTYIFFIYIFCFLVFWCYISITGKQYFNLLFTVPFWFMGYSMFKKHVLKSENKSAPLNPGPMIGALLVGVCFIAGVILTFVGIKDSYEQHLISKNYMMTTAYFETYDIYDSNEDGITYQLTYVYYVGDQDYHISTNYGTSYIPDINSAKEIRYNPDLPSDAVFVSDNRNQGIIFIGLFFTFGSLVFVIAWLSIQGYFDKFKVDVLGTYMGVVCLFIGIGFIYLSLLETGSLLKTINSFGLWILIPIMMIGVGILQIVKCVNKAKGLQ